MYVGDRLWFDVGIKRYTTVGNCMEINCWLWFDVGIKRYTTPSNSVESFLELWFDVGIKRYTTRLTIGQLPQSCGLM